MESNGEPGVPIEQRRHFRVARPGTLKVALDTQSSAVDVLDIGVGGFAILTAGPIPPGRLFRVELQLPSRPVVQLRAKCVYCSRTPTDSPGVHRAGFAFITWTGDEARALARLIGVVTGASSAE